MTKASTIKNSLSTLACLAAVCAGFTLLGKPAEKPVVEAQKHHRHRVAPAAVTHEELTPIPPPQGRKNGTVPNVITAHDTERYRAIFAAQDNGDWQEADRLAAGLDDKILMGYVLADRYLSKSYKASEEELYQWLTAYADHPQASDIYHLATARHKPQDPKLPEISRRLVLAGYGDDNGLASSTPDIRWTEGLAAWQAGSYGRAAESFKTLSNAADSGVADNISPWQASAASFWAYRALNKQGKHAEASRYLARAAQYPRTFYGVLARKVRGESVRMGASKLPEMNDDTAASLFASPAVMRAVALAQLDEDTLAENELRAIFLSADKDTRVQLLTLANTLNLPALQISMASVLKRGGTVYDVALYPAPEWKPARGFAVEPALVFAFARQESGFRAAAHSRDGGMGLMQLMPGTARHMQTISEELAADNIFEPSTNLALGQSYIGYLMQSQQVNSNLIYLAASYNAGPAKVAEWQKTIHANGDPLLFLERIPYSLTRNYVTQVLASYWVYQEIDGRRAQSAIALSRGQWPRYEGTPSATSIGVASADAADRG